MKKLIGMAITAGVLSLALGAADTEASSYKIKPGDTLWKVASSNDVSVANLKSWNRLSTDAIYPNQVLRLTSPSTASTPAPSSPAAPATVKTSTYTVKAGDTLYKVANAHATSVAKIQQLNNLSTSTIHVGQKLKSAARLQLSLHRLHQPRLQPLHQHKPIRLHTVSSRATRSAKFPEAIKSL